MTEGLRVVRVRVPLRTPMRGVAFRQATLVQGGMGWGESSPMPGYPVASSTCDSAAIEAAVLGLPDPVRDRVRVSALVPDEDLNAAVRRAGDAVAAGFGTVKLKVGDPGDVARVLAVRREIGPEPAIRLDANGAWDVPTARRRLLELAAADVEFVEEPVAGLEAMAELRLDVTVPIAADESVRSAEDVRRLTELGAADLLVVKVQACGGALRALHWAEDARLPVVVTSMMETSVGLAAGLAVAAALPELRYACGLATAELLAGDVVSDPLLAEGGEMRVRRPEPDEGLLARYSVEAPG
ncbi:MAG TPA: enolase C-terminal domain-like protein [Acidimicrobiia bacterium]